MYEKHTPGPWEATEGSYGNYIRVKAERGTVARIPWGREDTEYDNADAHLIAAAPELCSALETAIGFIACGDESDGARVLSKAMAAIKKARGE